MTLDDDLASWAAAVRLTEADAEAIFRRIAGTPRPELAAPLDSAWWSRYTAGFAGRMVASTRPLRIAA